MERATVETPVSVPSSAGGSRSESSPAAAPAGTTVTHGDAGSALIAAAERALAEEKGAASSAAGTPAPKAGDTAEAAGATGTEQPPKAGQPPDPSQAGKPEAARNTELETQFTRVARNAQSKVLEALGLKGVTYEQLPQVRKDIGISIGILRDLRKDPRDFHRRLGAELEAQGGGSASQPFKFPDGALVAEDGKTRTYSQEQIVKEIVPYLEKQITQALLSNGALSKVINYVDEETERKASEATTNQRQQNIRSVLVEARKSPHFSENEKDIMAQIAEWHQNDPEMLQARGVAWAVQAAYTKVLNEKVYGQGYENAVEQRIRENMRKKAAGGSGPAVEQGRTDGKKKELNSVDALAAHMREMDSASA